MNDNNNINSYNNNIYNNNNDDDNIVSTLINSNYNNISRGGAHIDKKLDVCVPIRYIDGFTYHTHASVKEKYTLASLLLK